MMLPQFAVFLLFEIMQPSSVTLAGFFPNEMIAASIKSSAPAVSNIPFKKTESIAPVLEAPSFFAIDLTTGTPLLSRDIFTRRSIASIAKLVTAMVILDSHQLNETVIVSKNAVGQEGSTMWLKGYETLSVEALLTGLLINSGNDAAVALAEFDAGTEENFVIKMNLKALDIGLNETHFSNAKGFDEKENYSTAFDTMKFSRAALAYPFIRKTVALKKAEVTSLKGTIKHRLESTNELLENPYWTVVGLKTGRSPAAGQSFVALTKGPNHHEILTIIFDSPNRFKESKILIDWVLRHYEFP